MKSPSAPPPPLSDAGRVTDSVRAQFLATEHWSLLANRSLLWNETFSRASMFLTVLSAAVVALAFVAQATSFGHGFRLFALVVLPVVLLLGLGTFVRLFEVNELDIWLVIGMNRLRHAYLEMAPELEPYFVTGHNDDVPSVLQSYTPDWTLQPQGFGAAPIALAAILSSTPHLIAAIDILVAGVFVALLSETLGASFEVSALIGAACGFVLLVVLFWSGMRRISLIQRRYQPRFPSSPMEERPNPATLASG